MTKIEDIPCPECGEKNLRIQDLMVADTDINILSSLSGMQMKYNSRFWPHVVCECGFRKAAK